MLWLSDARRNKFDAKGIKCLFLGYCKGTKAYRFMCAEIRKIIRSRDVVFDEDSTIIGHTLEMSPSGSSETPLLVLVDESSKPTLSNASDDDDSNKEELVGDNEVVAPTPSEEEEAKSIQEPRYPRKEQWPPGEWWKNHILLQQEVEGTNVPSLEDPFNVCKAMRSEDVSKWKVAMQEEYDSLIANGMWESPWAKGSTSRRCSSAST